MPEAQPSEPLDDEKLDDLLNNDQPTPEVPPDQPSDEPEQPNPENPDDVEDDEDDADQILSETGVDVDEESDDPKDVAIRNLRNANKRLKKGRRPAQTPPTPPNPEPTPETPRTVKTPLANRFLNNEFKTSVMFEQQTDPSVVQRVPLIKKIMFEEMPELLEKPNGFEIANDLAKGRTITVTPNARGTETQPQTTPARPRGATPKTKEVSQQQYDRMSAAEREAYENSLIGSGRK